MVFNSVPQSKQKDALGSLITYFAGTVAHLPEVKLGKLIYIAQLYHYSDHGESMTEARFFSLGYGPHAPILRSAVRMQLEKNTVCLAEARTSSDPVYSNPCYIIKLCRPCDESISCHGLSTLRAVTEDWADKPYEQILDYTVRTMPYLSTGYRELIDWTSIRPNRDLKAALSAPQRARIHRFIERPEETAWRDLGEGPLVTINEVAEIYLALCGVHPDKVPPQEYLGFDLEAARHAIDFLRDGRRSGVEKARSETEKAARMADHIFNSMSFRSYSARVALTTAMLFLRRSGFSFCADALEDHWPEGNTYKAFMEWFGMKKKK
jgi:hypothetical protein